MTSLVTGNDFVGCIVSTQIHGDVLIPFRHASSILSHLKSAAKNYFRVKFAP